MGKTRRSFLVMLCLLLAGVNALCSCSGQTPEYTQDRVAAGSPLLPDTGEPEKVEEPEPVADPSIPYSENWMLWFSETTNALQEEYPDGSYWNHIGHAADYLGVTDRACNHRDTGPIYCNRYNCASTRACGWGYGTQCAGFAGLLSDRVFGTDAPVYKFYDYDAIRPGDQARINNDQHSVFILEKTDEYVIVAECNAGGMNTCQISWGRKIPREQMGGFYLTRMEQP